MVDKTHRKYAKRKPHKKPFPLARVIFVLALIGVTCFGIYAMDALDKSLFKTTKVIVNPTGSDDSDGVHGNETTQSDTPWYLTLVNRNNPIPQNYAITLTRVPGGELVDERIYQPLMDMLDAAKAQGLDPIVVAGYRTQQKQQSLYDEKIESYRNQGYSENEATRLAGQWVPLPGTSEHQLGLAVDINGATYDIYQWLQENSYQYGFIFRYPKDKTDITGTAQEVWHYRYVGVEAATEIYKQGLCLEEYLANLSDES